jgi:hypothetical protein
LLVKPGDSDNTKGHKKIERNYLPANVHEKLEFHPTVEQHQPILFVLGAALVYEKNTRKQIAQLRGFLT